ncbi:MAG: DVUA0089 family protein [Bryobacteraceae bacterium]|nr:DVUA0089 family protein [Bryobacteraceae bacterium]
MRTMWPVVFLLAAAECLCAARVEPKLASLHPFTGQRGTTFDISARGTGLAQTNGLFVGETNLRITVQGIEPGTGSKGKAATDIVKLRVEAGAGLRPGRYPIRLVTPGGISNALALHIVEQATVTEPAGIHETADSAIAIDRAPVVINGRIDDRGESDLYAFEAAAGQTITFEVLSGLPAPGAAGGNARGFDPSISIWEASGSWFDPKRLNRIAFNDEPLWVLGQSTDAHLVHTFSRAGRYFLRLEAFSGQGGPDYSYQLKILPGRIPPDREPVPESWEERRFTRSLSANRLNELAARGGKPQDRKSIETYRAAPVSGEATAFKLPGTLEGVISQPGEAHHARFQVEGPQDVAIEVETPETAPPLFNPVVRLLNEAGNEVATSILAGKGACTGALTKSLQAKTIVPLRDPGTYTVEIRDVASDLAGPGFHYRVQVRPQVPHAGQVRIDADIVNIAPGEAKTVRVVFDREEDYRGAVAVGAESLPEGVQALAGADFEPDKDPPAYTGKRERYLPRTERAVVVFTASADAAATPQPVVIRIVVRPVMDGKAGAVLAFKEIPMLVVKP